MKYFGTLWKKLRRKIVIPPPCYPSNIFPYQQLCETQNGSLAKFFRSCERNSISTKPWSFPPPLLETFRYQKSFETQKFIGTERQKNFDGRSWFPPPPPPYPKFFRYRKFCETKKGSPSKFFGTVRQQSFYRKSLYSPLRHKVSRYANFSETHTGYSAKFFAIVRQIFFNRKSWHPFP